MTSHGFLYNLVLLLHLSAVVVGFGSNFVLSALAARGRDLGPEGRRALGAAAQAVSKSLTTGPIIATGILGLVLVLLSEQQWEFKQSWISIAFLLYFAVVGVLVFLIGPNAKAMAALGATLAEGGGSRSAGGPPAEVAELEARGKRAAMFTGITHLLWLLLMIDMIWKPGAV